MFRLFLSAVLLTLATAVPSRAEPADLSDGPPALTWASGEALPDSARAVLQTVANWLSANFDLPASQELPRLARVPQARMIALRYRGLAAPAAAGGSREALMEQGQNTVAIYDDITRTIYLPENWTGSSAAELSVLVHEMVHHLQNVGGVKHDCPQAREKLAYAAQDRWLAQFGRNLQDELEVDPFAILVRSTCAY